VEPARCPIAAAGDVRQEHRRSGLQGKLLAHEPQRGGCGHGADHVLENTGRDPVSHCGFDPSFDFTHIRQDVFWHIFRGDLFDNFHPSHLELNSLGITAVVLRECHSKFGKKSLVNAALPAYLCSGTTWCVQLPELVNECQHGFIPQHLPLFAMLVENILQGQVGVVECN
jgi:hypothetical protein